MGTFYTIEPEPMPVRETSSAVAAIDKPSWANGLPSHQTLVYVRDLGAAALVVVLGSYVIARALRDPGAALGAIRRRAGV